MALSQDQTIHVDRFLVTLALVRSPDQTIHVDRFLVALDLALIPDQTIHVATLALVLSQDQTIHVDRFLVTLALSGPNYPRDVVTLALVLSQDQTVHVDRFFGNPGPGPKSGPNYPRPPSLLAAAHVAKGLAALKRRHLAPRGHELSPFAAEFKKARNMAAAALCALGQFGPNTRLSSQGKPVQRSRRRSRTCTLLCRGNLGRWRTVTQLNTSC